MPRVAWWRRLAIGARPRCTLLRAVALAILILVVFQGALVPVRGVGVSMAPTIEPGQIVLVNRLAYRLRPPRRGEIVAVRLAGRRAVYVKRLVALPGERLAIRAGEVLIDGERLEEPYVVHRRPWQLDETLLGDDEYFVVGDNRGMPMAQHDMGTTPRARLLGPVIVF